MSARGARFDAALALARAEHPGGRFPVRRNTDPLRGVVRSSLHCGTTSIFAGFKGYWYTLALDCGHTVDRTAHAKAPPGKRLPKGYARQHHGVPEDWIQPPPARVRCPACARDVRNAAKEAVP